MRLSTEEVEKFKIDFIKLNGDRVKNSGIMSLIDTIEALQQELYDLQLYSIQMQNGEIDMQVTGENAKVFIHSLIQFFEQNGGKSFVTTTGLLGEDKYEVTVRKCGGLSVAEKMDELQQEIDNWQKRYEELDAGHSRLYKDFCEQRGALKKAREALYAARIDVLTKETDELAREAITEIDRAIGGIEDA